MPRGFGSSGIGMPFPELERLADTGQLHRTDLITTKVDLESGIAHMLEVRK
jgi:hypothetical protein